MSGTSIIAQIFVPLSTYMCFFDTQIVMSFQLSCHYVTSNQYFHIFSALFESVLRE